jgi:hypothetical protein
VPPTTATWRTLELSGSATVSLRLGSSAGIAGLDCNGALAASVVVMLLYPGIMLFLLIVHKCLLWGHSLSMRSALRLSRSEMVSSRTLPGKVKKVKRLVPHARCLCIPSERHGPTKLRRVSKRQPLYTES